MKTIRKAELLTDRNDPRDLRDASHRNYRSGAAHSSQTRSPRWNGASSAFCLWTDLASVTAREYRDRV
jgi:hypothetical protein